MREVIRVGTVSLLLALTAIGLRARGALSAVPTGALDAASGHAATALVVVVDGAALIGGAVLVVLLLRRPRRRKRGDDDFEFVQSRPPAPWWARPLGIVVAMALLAIPIVIFFDQGGNGHAAARGTSPPAPLTTPRTGTGHALPPAPGTVWPTVAGVIVAVLALAVLAAVARRSAKAAAAPDGAGETPGDASGLAAGVLAGGAALRAAGGPRQAIIDCYAAMERGLADAGTPPAAADTPGEVLARAARSAVIRGTAARDLTGLFRRARYSRQPVTEADRDAAANALARLRSDLGSPLP